MRKIKIKRNTLVDTRTATRVPTFCEFDDGNHGHCDDVRNMMFGLAAELENRGSHHDYTKLFEPHRSLFYRELCAKIEGKMDSFVCGVWYPMHCVTERHHLNEYCPEDINLIFVVRVICHQPKTGIKIARDVLSRVCIRQIEYEFVWRL